MCAAVIASVSASVTLELWSLRRGLVIEADVNRQEAFGAQGGEKAGADQRGLTESGQAEEHGERLAFDAAKKFLRFGGAPVEIFRGLFGEGVQAEPGMLVIHLNADGQRRRLGRKRWRIGHAHRETPGSVPREALSSLHEVFEVRSRLAAWGG